MFRFRPQRGKQPERGSKSMPAGRSSRWRGAVHDCLTRVWMAQARGGKRPRRLWSAEWAD